MKIQFLSKESCCFNPRWPRMSSLFWLNGSLQYFSAWPSTPQHCHLWGTEPSSCNDSPTWGLGLGLVPGTVSFETFIWNKGSVLLLQTISTQVSDVCQSSDQRNLVLKGKVIIIFTGDCTGIYTQRNPSHYSEHRIILVQNYPFSLKN